MAKNYSQEIMDGVNAYINGNDWKKVERDEENGIIRMRFSVKGSLDHIRLIIDVQEKMFLTLGVMDMKVPEANRKEAAEYLSRANYGLRFGNFEIDMSDGEVRFKCAVDCDHITPSEQMIDRAFDIPIAMFGRYGDDLLKVMFGVASAEEAVKHAEGNVR